MRAVADCEATVNAEADDEREKEAMRRDLDALQQQLVTVVQELADTKSVAIAASEVSLNELARCVGEALYEGHLKPYLKGLKEASKCQDPSFKVPAFDYHQFIFGLVRQSLIPGVDVDTLPFPIDGRTNTPTEEDDHAAHAMWVELEDWDLWDLFEGVASTDLRIRASRNTDSHPKPTFSLFYMSFQSVLEAKGYSREGAMALYELGAVVIDHAGNWRGPALPPRPS
ncbi:uncharacterized protein JCM10292_002143 [Rhodotorula paludigena]|uniref:uncharacterized protein n=1 Tax=Rhodotorula paludigena TaxID=86838 RepID=UPI00316DA588